MCCRFFLTDPKLMDQSGHITQYKIAMILYSDDLGWWITKWGCNWEHCTKFIHGNIRSEKLLLSKY